MMKTILVPVDFSDCSTEATKFAAKLAKRTGAGIFLLHVIETGSSEPGFSTSGEMPSVVGNAEIPFMIAKMHEVKVLMRKLKENAWFDGIEVTDNIITGSAPEFINEAARRHHADIIVMGTHGASGIKEFLIGSTAEKVVRYATLPVISIREDYEFPDEMLFASDFTPEAEKIIARVFSLADEMNVSVRFLKVIEDEAEMEQSRKSVSSLIERHKLGDIGFDIVKADSKEQGIREYADRTDAKLIAIGTHGRTGLAAFFNNSISEALVNHSLCPVMTVNFGRG